MTKFDLYKGTSKVQSSVDSPIVISDLTPETQYDDYSVSYARNEEKTPVSFKTEAQTKVSVTGVTVSPKTIAMKVGEAKQVAGAISPETSTDKGMTYSSENEAIAKVASDGTITAVAVGVVNVVVTTADGNFTDKAAVTVAE